MMVVAAVAVTIGVFADTWTDPATGYTWTYRINGGTAEIYKDSRSAAIYPKPTGAVTIPSTLGGKPVTSIGYDAFWGCGGLTSVTIPDSVTSVGFGAFEGCASLTSVMIPNSVTSIGQSAFESCSGLVSVTIPDSVASIGYRAFTCCSGLMSFSVGGGNANYKSVNGLLLSKDGKTLVAGITGDVTIPDGVASIGYMAFTCCSGLTRITIPNSVNAINDYAFADCGSVRQVVIPDSVTYIGEYSFSGCTNLQVLTIGNGVKRIANYAFANCGEMTNVTIGVGVSNICDNAFYGCKAISTITIPTNVKLIGSEAFKFCGATNIVISASVRNIEFAAFSSMSNLQRVDMLGAPPTTRIREATASSYTAISGNAKPSPIASAGTSGGMGMGSTSGMLVFYQCPSTAVGYYRPDYAKEWKAVLTPNGTWQGLKMQEKQMPVVLDLNPNGGSIATQCVTVVAYKPVGELPVPVKVGYEFLGWFTEMNYGTEIMGASVFTEDATLYAHWVKNSGGVSSGDGDDRDDVDSESGSIGENDGTGVGDTSSSGGDSSSIGGASSGETSVAGETFVIRTEEDFYQYIAESRTMGKTFVLANDLTLTGRHIVQYSGGPVDSDYHFPVAFYGTLKGNGHTIRLAPSCTWIAVFGDFGGATVENVKFSLTPQAAVSEYGAERTAFSNVLVEIGILTGGDLTKCTLAHCEVNYAGSRDNSYRDYVYGCFGGKADNCRFVDCKGTGMFPRMTNASVGGLLREAVATTFDGCRFEGTVESNYGAGGLVAKMSKCLVQNCEVKATIAGPLADGQNATGWNVGGIAGTLSSSTVQVCRVEGSVSQLRHPEENVGGIAGVAEENSLISLCVSSADIIGRENVGGIVGYLRGSDIENTFSSGAVKGFWNVGGVVGQSVGYASRRANIVCSVASGDVIGLAADLSEECRYLGGFAGHLEWSDVSWCYATGLVSCTGKSLGLGGFVGEIEECTRISTSYATGSVAGDRLVGGFSGMVYAPTEYGHATIQLRNCYARGSVTETTTSDSHGVAAFAADIGSSGDTISVVNCYATGKVTASAPDYDPFSFTVNTDALAQHGGLSPILGEVFGVTIGMTGSAISSYWDMQTTGQTRSGLMGMGKTTAEMGRQSTYVGWDFGTVWIMQNGYPVFRACADCLENFAALGVVAGTAGFMNNASEGGVGGNENGNSTPTTSPTPTPTPTPQPPLYGITIGIDPGHQTRPDYATEPIGPDTEEQTEKCTAGTRGIASNVYEYEVNLSVAKKLVPLLEAKGATVVLTRTENDVNLSERERAGIINAYAVDLAILLHCNGTDDTSVRGAFVLVPSRERTATFSENVRAAKEIVSAYCERTGIAQRSHNGVAYRDDLTCFNWCERPVVCLEMGHLSNETEDLLLTNDAFQDKMAVGILEGILAYFNSAAAE